MFEQTYKLVKFFEDAQKINGRKKLQKMIHLLQSAGEDFDMDYYYHYYGPYSSDLQLEVQYLGERGFLNEEKVGDSFTYEITGKGKQFLRNYEETIGNKQLCNQELTGMIDKLKSNNPHFLELLSTYVYLIESGYDKQSAIKKAKELKPDLSYLLSGVIDFFEDNLEGTAN